MIRVKLNNWQNQLKMREERCVITLDKEFSKDGLFRRQFLDFQRK